MANKTQKAAEKTTDGRPTVEQINTWKEQHGGVYKIKVEQPNGPELVAIVREPKMRDLKLASAVGKTKSDIDVLENLYTNCKLYADDDITKYPENAMSVYMKMGEIKEIRESSMEKL